MGLSDFFKREEVYDIEQITKFLRAHYDDFARHLTRVTPNLYEVTMFLLLENMELYEAMGILMRKNKFRACIPLARSLLENAVTLKYIYAADSEKRAENHKMLSRYSYLKRMMKVEPRTPEISNVIEFVKKELGDYDPKRDQISMKKMFIALNMEDAFDEWYGRLSEYAHSRYRINPDVNTPRPFNDFLRLLVFKHVLVMILESLRVATERFDLDGGVLILENYPEKNATFMYATNPKKMGPIGL